MLAVSQLRFERYFQPVFLPLDFQLDAGGLLLVTGVNGCGKTTLIRLLAGILTPSGGSIQQTASSAVYVGHQLAIKDDLTVFENAAFMRQFLGSGVHSVEGAVRRVGLHSVSSQLARTLSAGQRKRCALTRLIFSEAHLWLLDEPYSNLDDEGVALVDGLVASHLQQGGSCILATHGRHRPPIENCTEIRLQPGSGDDE